MSIGCPCQRIAFSVFKANSACCVHFSYPYFWKMDDSGVDVQAVVAVEHLQDLGALLHTHGDVLDQSVRVHMETVLLAEGQHLFPGLLFLEEAMHNDHYIAKSLELHLFFGRIMKEHALFLRAGFTPANAAFSNQAEIYKNEFEKLLCETVALSNGAVSPDVLNSGEVVTEFTALAEKQTECFTGIAIDRKITSSELRLSSNCNYCNNNQSQKVCTIHRLNERAIQLLDGLICFKESILKNVLNCQMFTMNYPLLIEHIIREAKLYRKYLHMLEKDGELNCQSMREIECFWNRIMMEHALFIRGLLDPCEAELIDSADESAKEFAELLLQCSSAQDRTLTASSLEKTVKLRDFKAAGTKGIQECKIRSVILPLLADHVLREANHYIRLLKD